MILSLGKINLTGREMIIGEKQRKKNSATKIYINFFDFCLIVKTMVIVLALAHGTSELECIFKHRIQMATPTIDLLQS